MRYLMFLLMCGAAFGVLIPISDLTVTRASTAYSDGFVAVGSNASTADSFVYPSQQKITVYDGAGDINNVTIAATDSGMIYMVTSGTNKYLLAANASQFDGTISTATILLDTQATIGQPGYNATVAANKRSYDRVTVFRVLSDGSWLICLGEGAVVDDVGGIRPGMIYRSTDQGVTWSLNQTLDYGFVPNFGFWNGSEQGGEVVVGEYGTGSYTDYPRSVWYSADYGVTWAKIFEPTRTSANMHCHLVTFAPNDTDTIYAAYGDDSPDKFITKLTVVGDKTNPANWTSTIQPFSQNQGFNSTVAHVDGDYLYFGRDGAGKALPGIMRVDPTDDSIDMVYANPQNANTTDYPYTLYNGDGRSFGMFSYGGVIYAGFLSTESAEFGQDPDWIRGGGVYASIDGENWVCVSRQEIDSNAIVDWGTYSAMGQANGFIWGTFKTTAGELRIYKLPLPTVQDYDFTLLGSGATNLFTEEASAFVTTIGGWSMDTSTPNGAVARSTEKAIVSDGSFKFTGADNSGASTILISPRVSGFSDGDLICFSCYVNGENWPQEYDIQPQFAGAVDCTIAQSSSSPVGTPEIHPSSNWRKITIWGKLTVTGASPSFVVWLFVQENGKGTSFYDGAELYVDAAQVYRSQAEWDSGRWQIGGTARADGSAVADLSNLTADTVAFRFRPDISSREVTGDLPIATLTDGTKDLDIYFDFSEDELIIDDGSITAGSTVSWDFRDITSIAVTRLDTNVRLSIASSKQELLHVYLESEFEVFTSLVIGADSSSNFGRGNYGLIEATQQATESEIEDGFAVNSITKALAADAVSVFTGTFRSIYK
jgi:hypothetical protein